MTTNHHPSRIRDDCWTESATETLIESWGDRYLHLNRGNLRQNDWRDVANAVNSLRDKSKPPRTDVQCKNRIDTLKKKYKAEKAKLTVSKWPFYYKLDELIGTNVNVIGTKNKKLSDPKSSTMKDVAYCDGDDEEDDEEDASLEGGGGTSACGELAKSILRFGEVYERVESLKEEEVMEMEKRRIEFAREVEIRRLDMFMETQLEIEKMKMKMKMKMMKKKKKKKTLSTTGLLTTGKKTEQ